MNSMDINDINKYFYTSENIVMFPSTNSRDSGKLTSEENIRDIVTRITELNYRLDPESFVVSTSGLTLEISQGMANIRGYKIITIEQATLDFSKENDGKYYIYIALYRDNNNTGNLHGDEYDISDNIDRFLGAYVSYTDSFDENEFKERLFLGTVDKNRNNIDFTINPHIDCRIDPNDIIIDFYGKPERSYHGTYNLFDFVNLTDDIYVSKFGDTIYDSLYFTSMSYSPGYTDKYPYNPQIGLITIPKPTINNPLSTDGVTYSSTSYIKGATDTTVSLQASANHDNNGLIIDTNNITTKLKVDNNSNQTEIISSYKNSDNSSNKILFITGAYNTSNNGIYITSDSGIVHIEGDSSGNKSTLSGYKSNISTTYNCGSITISPKNKAPYEIYDMDIYVSYYNNSHLYPELVYCGDLRLLYRPFGSNPESFPIIHSDKNGICVSTKFLFYNNKLDSPGISVYQKYTKINDTDDNYPLSIDGCLDVLKSIYARDKLTVSNDNNSSKSILSYDSLNTKDINCTGNIEARGTIRGSKVYNAVYNDYADFIKKDESENYEPGDIIAKKPNSDNYTLATYDNRRLVVGVYSDNYGHILGGENLENMEDNKKKYIPLGVAGNVDVKVVGCINEGDLITVSKEYPGVGERVSNLIRSIGCIVGKALESKETEDIDIVKMQIMLA